jgi:hypothetical protein
MILHEVRKLLKINLITPYRMPGVPPLKLQIAYKFRYVQTQFRHKKTMKKILMVVNLLKKED